MVTISEITSAINLSSDSSWQSKIESGRNKAEVILKEANKGYDLIVMGAIERQVDNSRVRLNLQFDRVVREANCATMVVKSNLSNTQTSSSDLYKISHILVPTTGTNYSRHAVEVASTIYEKYRNQ